MNFSKEQKRIMRHKRVRAKINGTGDCPRLVVFRSNKYVSLQLVDDNKQRTILSVNDFKADKGKKKITKTESAYKAGEKLAKLAKEKKIVKVVFDRGGYAFHGRVKAVAEGARSGGLKF